MPSFAAFVARHRVAVLVLAALAGLVASGGLRSTPPPVREALPALVVADFVPVIAPAAAAPAPIRLAANETPKAPAAGVPPVPPVPAVPPVSTEADEPAPDADAAPSGKAKKRKKGATVGITIDDDEKVRISGGDGSREFDSFEAFVHQAPWIAGLVFAVTFLVFLTPILIIALVIWYKVRKTRMLNETMVRLAEKGVVPPAEAFGAVASGTPLQSAPSTTPLYEQAKEVRRRAVWSDLRKGIVMGAIGLGLVFYSMLEDGTPNALGLVLLFVGLGYIVLWYFEDRQLTPPSPPRPPSPPGPPSA